MDHLNNQQMKQNMDINILHNRQHTKQSKQTVLSQKSIKRQLFGQINNELNQTKKLIKKTAYIVDSQEQNEQDEHFYEHFIGKTAKSPSTVKSIDQVSQIIQSLSRQTSIPNSPRPVEYQKPITMCSIHNLGIFTNNFCLQCSSYLICPSCISSFHFSHMILSYNSENQAKQLTKQFLIQKIEQSLQKMKSKQNDLKNKTYQTQIILKALKKIQGQIIQKLENTFIQIRDLIRNVYDKQQRLYEASIDKFYKDYNLVGDQLRQNLLTIIQQSFTINSFSRTIVQKQPPQVPNPSIDKFKSTLQKTKRFYKMLGQHFDQLKTKSSQLSRQLFSLNSNLRSISNLNLKNSHQNNQTSIIPIKRDKKASIQKYEKFLSQSCYNNNNNDQQYENKSSLMKILNTLSSS